MITQPIPVWSVALTTLSEMLILPIGSVWQFAQEGPLPIHRLCSVWMSALLLLLLMDLKGTGPVCSGVLMDCGQMILLVLALVLAVLATV